MDLTPERARLAARIFSNADRMDRIVEAHGGRSEARAGDAGGAVFTIRLPRGPLAGSSGR